MLKETFDLDTLNMSVGLIMTILKEMRAKS